MNNLQTMQHFLLPRNFTKIDYNNKSMIYFVINSAQMLESISDYNFFSITSFCQGYHYFHSNNCPNKKKICSCSNDDMIEDGARCLGILNILYNLGWYNKSNKLSDTELSDTELSDNELSDTELSNNK